MKKYLGKSFDKHVLDVYLLAKKKKSRPENQNDSSSEVLKKYSDYF